MAFSHYNHLSAQLPLNPATDEIVSGGIKEQTDQCLRNIQSIIESINHSMDDVVKVNIFLKDINDIESVDEIYKKYFPKGVPARRTVGVAALLKDALIQIDAVVSNAEGTPPKI